MQKVLDDDKMNLTPNSTILTISSDESRDIPDTNKIVTKQSLTNKTNPTSRVSSVTAFKVDRDSPVELFAPENNNQKRSTYHQLLKAGKTEEVKLLVSIEEKMES